MSAICVRRQRCLRDTGWLVSRVARNVVTDVIDQGEVTIDIWVVVSEEGHVGSTTENTGKRVVHDIADARRQAPVIQSFKLWFSILISEK
jgi:hypothetical protein